MNDDVPLRTRVARALDPALRTEPGLSATNRWVIVAVLISVLVAVLGTESSITEGVERWFEAADALFLLIFGLEYLARLWVCVDNPAYRSRLHYALRWPAVIDLLTLLAVLLSLSGSSGFLLRLLRVARLLRLAHLGRFSAAMDALGDAIWSRRFELLVSACFAALLLLFSSALLYVVEGGEQPKAFGSIPRAMWWAIATLTTVGYGDVYPVTAVGRVLAAITAISGIGLIAMPAGILAGAFSDAMQRAARRADADR